MIFFMRLLNFEFDMVRLTLIWFNENKKKIDSLLLVGFFSPLLKTKTKTKINFLYRNFVLESECALFFFF